MSTTKQVVDCVLANNHAEHDVEGKALKVDDDLALTLHEPKRCRQTEQTLRVDDEAFLSTVSGIQPPSWRTSSKSGRRCCHSNPFDFMCLLQPAV